MDRTICIFGDSIVQASYVKESWAEQLRIFLEKKHENDFINVFRLGVGGNTTADLLKRFDNESEVRKPSTVIFQIGTNDSGYFKVLENLITEENIFRNNLEDLITKAKKFTEDILFLGLSIGDDSLTQPLPQSSKGKTYTKERIAKYDNILKEITVKNSCKYVPLIDKLKPEDFMDGLHPNESGHSKIFNEVSKLF